MKKIIIIILVSILAIITGVVFFAVVNASSPVSKLARQLDLGKKYLEEEDFDRALVAFDEALSIDPKCVEAYLGKTEAYEGLGDIDGAIETLTEGYNRTENKKLKKELESIIENEVEELVNKGKEDKAIKLMQDVQEDIDETLFDDKINALKTQVENDAGISNANIQDGDASIYCELDQYYIELFSELSIYNFPGDQFNELYGYGEGDPNQDLINHLESLYQEEAECSELDESVSLSYEYSSFWDNDNSLDESVNEYKIYFWGEYGEAPEIYYDFADYVINDFGEGEKYAIYTGHEFESGSIRYRKQFLLNFANVICKYKYSSYEIIFDNTADALNPSMIIKYDGNKYIYYSYCYDCGSIHVANLKN